MNEIIFTLVTRGFGWNLMREIFTSLDGAIFSLFTAVIQLMFDIVDVTVKQGFYEDIQSRIYVILSIYMLFKVTISLITYVVNPDSMTDKSQGVGNLVQRIIVAIVMLTIFPTVFNKLSQYQSDIIEDHTIDNIILGSNSVTDQQNAGDDIGVAVYDGFIIRPKGNTISNSSTTGRFEGENKKVSYATDIVNEPGATKDEYKYEYIPFIGFALGAFMTILILSFCIDIAIRVFKLIILQLIAPIPIISYVDPKASKDGAFSKWIKMLTSTWISLFIRLVVIDFILLVIKEFLGGTGNIDTPGGIMVKVALIIGLLFFAKNMPKFIYDALGVKPPERSLFAGLGNIAAAGAIGAGAISGGIAGFNASRMSDDANEAGHGFLNTTKNIGAGLFGGLGGIGTGIGAAANAKDHNAKAVMEAMNKRNSAAIAAGAAGSSWWGRTKAGMQTALTGQNAAMKGERAIAAKGHEIDEMKAKQGSLKAIKSRVSGEMVKQNWTKGDLGLKSTYGDGNIQANYKSFMASFNAAKSAGADSVTFKDIQGRDQIISMEEAEMQSGFLLKNNEDDYLKEIIAGNQKDAVLSSQLAEADAYGLEVTDRSSVNDTIERFEGEIATATREKAAMQDANEKNKQDAKFSGK